MSVFSEQDLFDPSFLVATRSDRNSCRCVILWENYIKWRGKFLISFRQLNQKFLVRNKDWWFSGNGLVGEKQSSMHSPLKQELVVAIFILHLSGRKQRQHTSSSPPSRIAIRSVYESTFHFLSLCLFFPSNTIQHFRSPWPLLQECCGLYMQRFALIYTPSSIFVTTMTSTLDGKFPPYKKKQAPQKNPSKTSVVKWHCFHAWEFFFICIVLFFPHFSVLLNLCVCIVDTGPLFQDHV